MKVAGRITGEALATALEHIKEGVSTKHLDTVIRQYIEKCHAKPSFLGLYGFPASACISVNDEVIHGIPSKDRILLEGDIVKIDTGACINGYHGDSARTFAVGRISKEAEQLIKVTRESFFEGVRFAQAGYRIGDIGCAVQTHAEQNGCSVVRQYVGHGIGKVLHEDPEVPNFGKAGHGLRLYPGMTLAIEPMINQGSMQTKVLDNGWTVVTVDRELSAHYENTVAITENGPILLTDVGCG